MKMVGHQAVAEERERVPCLGARKIAKEHIPFALGAEDIGSVVPAVDRVVNITLAPKKLILTRRASEGSASEPSLARRVSMCKDAKLSCRGNKVIAGRSWKSSHESNLPT
jgi:hypothetical protein